MTEESYSSSIDGDEINSNSTSTVENSLLESETAPNVAFSLRLPKLTLEKSKSSIKQEEPEADHDYLCDKALNTPFKFSRNHLTKAFKSFDDLRKRKVLCDVILKANCPSDDQFDQNDEIYAHKIILASCSAYFRAMFSSNMCEATAEIVIINDVCFDALQKLIDFIYTCEISVTEDNVQSLLPAANLLQLSDVKDACCDFLQYQLHPTNCLGIQQFADLHSCKDLFIYSKQFTENHFREIMKHDEFVNLHIDQLESLISSNSLCAKEEEVFEAVKRWIIWDVNQRQKYLQNLFSHIRFPLLSREFLIQLTNDDDLMRSNQAFKDFLIEAMRYHLMSDDERSYSSCSLNTTPRKPVTNSQIMMVIGGQAPKAIRSIEELDLLTEQWGQLTELPSRRCRCGAVLNKGLVYVIGGFNGSLRVRSVDVYDPIRDRWHSAPQMTVRRSTLGVASFGGLIYAVGGFDGSQGLASAEVYDVNSNIWRELSPMSTRRSSVGVAVLHGILYAVGGYDGLQRECLASVEKYCPCVDSTKESAVGGSAGNVTGATNNDYDDDTNIDTTSTASAISSVSVNPSNASTNLGGTWTLVAPMNYRRSGAAVACLDGYLYAIGGHDGPSIRNSVERYSPKTNKWLPIASMHYSRRNAGAVTYNNRIYVVGGDDGTMNLTSVEIYDPTNDVWSILQSTMLLGRSYSAVLLIPGVRAL